MLIQVFMLIQKRQLGKYCPLEHLAASYSSHL